MSPLRRLSLTLLLGILASDPRLAGAQTVELELLALEGTPAPGTDGAFGRFYFAPRMGPGGAVGFLAFLAEGGNVDAENDLGLWLYRPGEEPVLVAREGSQAPGAPDGAVFDSIDSAFVPFDSGVVFRGTLRQGAGGVDASNDTGIWRGGAAPELVVRAGSGGLGGIATELAANRSGVVAFTAQAGFLLTELALVTADETGTLETIATTADAAPGFPLGASFDLLHSPSLDDAGALTFAGRAYGPGTVTADDDQGIWTRPAGGDLALVVREGDAAPGVAGAPLLEDFAGPTLAGDGVLVFPGTLDLDSPGIDETNQAVLWRADPGESPAVVFRSGELVPGFPGGTAAPSIRNLKRNAEGAFAFLGRIRVSPDEIDDLGAIFGPDGSGALVPRFVAGQSLSFVDPGLVLSSPESSDLADDTMLALLGYVQGPGVQPSNNQVVLWSEAGTPPVLVLRSGDELDVGAGDVRTVFSPYFQDGFGMSDAGELVLSIDFEDARGFVRARVVPAPEPSAAVLLAAGAAVLFLATHVDPGASATPVRGRDRGRALTPRYRFIRSQ